MFVLDLTFLRADSFKLKFWCWLVFNPLSVPGGPGGLVLPVLSPDTVLWRHSWCCSPALSAVQTDSLHSSALTNWWRWWRRSKKGSYFEPIFPSFFLEQLLIELLMIFSTNQSVVWSIKCQKMLIKVQDDVLKYIVLSTTKSYPVHCQRGEKKPENIHISKAEIREFWLLLF